MQNAVFIVMILFSNQLIIYSISCLITGYSINGLDFIRGKFFSDNKAGAVHQDSGGAGRLRESQGTDTRGAGEAQDGE